MLRDSFNDLWLAFQQFQVTLAGSVSEIGKKKPGVVAESSERHFKMDILISGEIPEEDLETVFAENKKGGRLGSLLLKLSIEATKSF